MTEQEDKGQNMYELGEKFYERRIDSILEKFKVIPHEDHLANIDLLEELRLTEVKLKFSKIRGLYNKNGK